MSAASSRSSSNASSTIRQLLFRARPAPPRGTPTPSSLRSRLTRRWNSTSTSASSSPGANGASPTPLRKGRFARAVDEMKKRPGTHLTAFLLLHELTAVAPLVPMYYFFQWTGLSASFLGGPMVGTLGQTSIPAMVPGIGGQKVETVMTEWIDTIARTVARVGSKYGIMGFHKVQQLRGKEKDVVEQEGANALQRGMKGISAGVRGKVSETVSGVSVKNVMDGVAAYAVVKALLPFRLAISISGTPWFATRIIGPVLQAIRRKKPAAVTATTAAAPKA